MNKSSFNFGGGTASFGSFCFDGNSGYPQHPDTEQTVIFRNHSKIYAGCNDTTATIFYLKTKGKKVSILATVGARNVLLPYSQTYGSFNLPVESFEMLAYDEPPRIVLNDNPINVYCLTNCVIDQDRLENKKPLKVSQTRKIDGAITLLMTLGQLYTYER